LDLTGFWVQHGAQCKKRKLKNCKGEAIEKKTADQKSRVPYSLMKRMRNWEGGVPSYRLFGIRSELHKGIKR